MDIEQICSIICLFILVIGLLALLFIAVGLTYKSEKVYRELRNEELKARIKFFTYHILDKH